MDPRGAAARAAATQQIAGLSVFGVVGGGVAAAKIPSALRATATMGDPKKEIKNGDGKMGCIVEAVGNQVPATAAAAAATVAAAGPVQLHQQVDALLPQQQKRELGSSSSSSGRSSMLTLAQKCTRTAKNGREQQRAQKITDAIDHLKSTLDKANFGDGSSSKLDVLMSCESYLRSLQDKVRCYEMEIKLREAARGHVQQSSLAESSSSAVDTGASPTMQNKLANWDEKSSATKALGGAPMSATVSSGSSTCSGETSRMDAGDDSSIGRNGGGGSSSASSCRGSKKRLHAASSCSSDDDESNLGDTSLSPRANNSGGGVLGISGVAPRGRSRTSSSAADNSSSTGSDGDTGSSVSSAGSTSAGTTDSASQGFTDTTSRGFTTDSSFSGYTGSMGSGDTGSADGGSDESEEGTSGARMRVVNYFDIFRLSNVPMAIADKTGALADVNDAMRGFGRINQDAVKSLTVASLVAPESSKALQDAMNNMLAASSSPQDPLAQPQPGAQPFLANAGIGNRPTLLTVSLVYDKSGEASAFHVALIPRSSDAAANGGEASSLAPSQRDSAEFGAGAVPEYGDNKKEGQKADEGEIVAEEGASAGKRGPEGTWEVGRQRKAQKRRASAQALHRGV